MKMNRFWALLLVLTMLLGMIPAVSAEGDVTEVSTSADFVTAMANGGNIKLTGSFTLSAQATVPADKTVVLDLNGKTITSTKAGSNFIQVTAGGALTVKDTAGGGGMTSTGTTSASRCIRNYGTLIVEGGTFTVTSQRNTYAIYSEGGNVTITGGSFTGTNTSTTANHAAGLGLKNSTAAIRGGTFTGNSKNTNTGSLVAAIIATEGTANITIEDGSFTGNRTDGSTVAAAAISCDTSKSATANAAIYGGSFSANGTTTTLFAAGVTPNITGGTFSEDISSYLGNGYAQNPDGSVSGSSQQPEATEVATSADFVAAMEKGGNIRLTGSFTLGAKATVPAGVTVTLDLNGHKITSNDGYNYNVNNAGTLTIIDSGVTGEISVVSADDVEQNIICINNTGSLTVEDGKFTAVSKKRTAYALYSESRDLTINGGEFVASLDKSASYSAHALALAGDASVEDSVATINGGTFTATSVSTSSTARCAPLFARSANKVHITINGGTFTGTRTDATRGASAWRYGDTSSNVTLTIKGGTFSAENAGDNGFVSAQKGTLHISGGTFRFDGDIFTKKPTSITGGTFLKQDGTMNDISANLSGGYSQMANGTVSKLETFEIDTFEDLRAAMAGGGKVTLAGDILLEGKVEIASSTTVVLDLNGKTISSNNGEEYHISNAGHLTITDSGENGTISVKSANKSANVICINNDGTLVIEDGNFSATSGNRTAYALFSKGKSVTINGGTFHAAYTKTNGVYQAQTLGLGGTDSTATINGGTFNANSTSEKTNSRCAAVYVMSGSNVRVTINGGSFTATRTVGVNGASVLRNESSATTAVVTVKGGTYIASAGTDCLFDVMEGKLEISGGTFTYDTNVFAEERGTVTGGKFVKTSGALNNITTRVAKNYVQLETGDVVSATNLPDVIQVGTKTYKTVWEAISKSTSGQMVSLLADAKTALAVSLDEGVILDLNGYTLETAGVFGDVAQIIDSKQEGLLKIPQGHATFNTMNSQLPLWDEAAGGYRLANTKIQVKAGTNGKFYFRFDLTKAQWELLLNANNAGLLIRVDGYEETYAVPQQWLDALYADTTGRGAISVFFANAPAQLDIRVSVASREVKVSKGTKNTALAPIGPTDTVDPLAADVRTYLAQADALYSGKTSEQLQEMTSPKLAGQSLNDSKKPITLTWNWDASIPADSQFTIELSQTEDFAEVQTMACTHFNANVSVQSEPFWNPLMDTTYYWRVVAKLTDGSTVTGSTSSFTTEEGLRMIRLSGSWNARDLGGWDTSEIVLSDGTVLPADKTTQGWVFRSANLQGLTAEGQATVLNELGIKTEIDLRDPKSSSDRATTCFKNGELTYITGPSTAKSYGAFITEPEVAYTYLIEFTKAENYPILFHCAIGADRTGSLAFLLNALQGVSLADLVKDYEITTDRFVQGLGKNNFPELLVEFNKLDGATAYEKARTFCRNAGLTDTQIDCIIQYMNGNLDYIP